MLAINKSLVASILVAATLVASASAALDVSSEYIIFNEPRIPTQDQIRDLKEIVPANPIGASEPAAIAEAIRAKSELKGRPAKEHEFFVTLAELAQAEGECTLKLRRYVHALFALAQKGMFPAVDSYVAYLETYAKPRYEHCAKSVKQIIEQDLQKLDTKTEEGLDQLVAANSGLEVGLAGNQELLEAAKGLDFTRDDIKARKMLKFSLESSFGVYNLAQAFGASTPSDVPLRFKKLNEYNRACQGVDRNHFEVVTNVRRLLSIKKIIHDMVF